MVIFTAKPTAICISTIAWQPSRVVEWKQAKLRGPVWTPGGFGGESGPLVPQTGPRDRTRLRLARDVRWLAWDRRRPVWDCRRPVWDCRRPVWDCRVAWGGRRLG